MTNDETRLWAHGDVECVMISCCAGAELQLRRAGEVVLRELYPTKSDLYERARALETAETANRGRERFSESSIRRF